MQFYKFHWTRKSRQEIIFKISKKYINKSACIHRNGINANITGFNVTITIRLREFIDNKYPSFIY